jgi:cytochrome c55X
VPTVRALPLLLGLCGVAAAAQPVGAAREQALVRMVRQDCGSCHGMHLTGGLGPALTREALADKPVESLAATIYQGRPGTPMPGWRPMLTETEAVWIAEQLLNGFPQERRASP